MISCADLEKSKATLVLLTPEKQQEKVLRAVFKPIFLRRGVVGIPKGKNRKIFMFRLVRFAHSVALEGTDGFIFVERIHVIW